MTTKELRIIREAVANYMRSEGCDCCRTDDYAEHKRVLAKLLKVPKYSDGGGFNFTKFQTKRGGGMAK